MTPLGVSVSRVRTADRRDVVRNADPTRVSFERRIRILGRGLHSIAEGNTFMSMSPAMHTSMPVTTTFTIEGYRIANISASCADHRAGSDHLAGDHGGPQIDRRRADRGVHRDVRAGAAECVRPAHRSCAALGANAIVGLRYDASEIGGKASSASEVLCYGTAVVIEPVQ